MADTAEPSADPSAAASPRTSMDYHLLASLMSLQPDFAIYRRFLASNARDLLRLQGEITYLERDLEFVAAADRASLDEEKREFDFCFASLKGYPEPHLSREKGLQWERQVELGHKLAGYRTALLQYKQLCELPSAHKLGLANLRAVLDSGDHGFPRDLENTIWSEENEADLTSLTGRYQKMDMPSQWIDGQLLRWYHNRIGHRLHDHVSIAGTSVRIPIIYYSDGKLAATVNAISTILSSVLPSMSIFALYYVQHQLARMAAIVAFSFLFSVVLTVIAKARRIACFAATTAFAAVQVVFVGTAVGNPRGR